MRKYSLSPDQLTFVGDSLKDAEKAIANGIKFIGKCGTFNRDDFLKIDNSFKTIENIRELIDL